MIVTWPVAKYRWVAQFSREGYAYGYAAEDAIYFARICLGADGPKTPSLIYTRPPKPGPVAIT